MRRGVISFLFIAIAVAVFFVWTRPGLGEITELRAEKAAINDVLSDSRELQEIRDRLLTQYNSIPAADLTRLSNSLPDSAEETKLKVQVSKIAQSSGVLLESFQTKEIATKIGTASYKQYDEVDLQISFTASYEALISFLQTMEKSLRLMDINEISFSAGDENSYSVSLKAKAYFKKD